MVVGPRLHFVVALPGEEDAAAVVAVVVVVVVAAAAGHLFEPVLAVAAMSLQTVAAGLPLALVAALAVRPPGPVPEEVGAALGKL